MKEERVKRKLYKIIFEADTKSGKLFDVFLLIAIILSVLCVILESVSEIHEKYHSLLNGIEWFFTILFTIEYVLRIYVVKRSIKYIFSFMGIIDFLAIIPTYLMFFFPPIHFLIDIRVIRLIRVFRIFKLSRYLRGAHVMQIALRSSRPKIIVFLLSVFILIIVLGTLMYIIEGTIAHTDGFDNIPNSMYWAIVTLTTVGYGGVVPVTILGKFIASFIMILGYGIIAVPTGIVSADMARIRKSKITSKTCQDCISEGHEQDAEFCKFCGFKLDN